MPGNPKECRQHADNCRRLAAKAGSVEGRDNFLSLADHWDRLAAELESIEPLITAINELEPPIAAE